MSFKAISQGEPGPIGSGPAWQDFLDRAERVAASEATLLIQGEHGVGKGWIARAIHGLSGRADGPLVEIDLSVGSPNLVESTLFGHEEGAFTGADKARLGCARRAHGGTLVLAGLDDLDLGLQVKLLRLLQEHEVEPLGAEAPVSVDVRVVATATRDLREQVELGTFREDLFYRLAVVRLDVPPLRVRFEGMGGWLPGMVEVAAAEVGRAKRELSPGAVERLAAHPWPGNVRELENALQRVLVLGAGDEEPVTPEEFDFLGDALLGLGGARELARQALAAGVQVDDMVGHLLAEALQEHRGKLAPAARAVGLSRKAFEYRLTKWQEESAPEGDQE
ncbi:MAG: sigma 54-interacting transcriptional regulator [Planctomycetota bacterium]|nr:sigma 54-interacting transcriptional regulator [Planctomycetota bacterium]